MPTFHTFSESGLSPYCILKRKAKSNIQLNLKFEMTEKIPFLSFHFCTTFKDTNVYFM